MVLKINRSVTKQFVRVLGLRLTGRLHEPENVLSAHLAELLSHLHGFSVWVIHVAVGTRFFGFATFPAIGELLEVGQIGFGDSATLTDILNSGLLALDPSLDQLTVVVVAQLGNIFPIQAFLDHGILDLKIINKLSNLRPMLGPENLQKADKYDEKEFTEWLRVYSD